MPPIHSVSFQVLTSKEFFAFFVGKSQFFTPGTPNSFQEFVFYPRFKSFRVEIRLRDIKADESKNCATRWLLKYRCTCPKPHSLFCHSLRMKTYIRWVDEVRATTREIPLPVHLGILAHTYLDHCHACKDETLLFILITAVNPNNEPYPEISQNPFRVSPKGVQICIPRIKKDAFPYRCLIRAMEIYFINYTLIFF